MVFLSFSLLMEKHLVGGHTAQSYYSFWGNDIFPLLGVCGVQNRESRQIELQNCFPCEPQYEFPSGLICQRFTGMR